MAKNTTTKGRGKSKGWWFWAARGAWFHTDPITRKRIKVADGPQSPETETAAKVAYHALMAQGGYRSPQKSEGRVTISELIELFLVNREQAGLKASTLNTYSSVLTAFRRDFGAAPADAFAEDDLVRWFAEDCPNWGQAMKSGAAKTLKAMFRWAASAKRRLIPGDPLDEYSAPSMPRRQFVYKGDLNQKIIDTAHKMKSVGFAHFWDALGKTGARPGEIATIEAQHCREVDGFLVADITDWKNYEKTQRTRTIIFRQPEMIRLVKELCDRHPIGKIFRTKNGNPWNRHKWSSTLVKIRRRLGLGKESSKTVCAYALRHTFITEGKRSGMDSLMLAKCCGNSVQMIEKHYGHLDVADLAKELSKMDRPL